VSASALTPGSFCGRVLVGADGPALCRAISAVLVPRGAQVEFAESGAGTIERVRQSVRAGRPFDCILIDMECRALDGRATAAQLRTLGYDRPILAITGRTAPVDRLDFVEAGCDEYVAKPIVEAHLIAAVTCALERSRKLAADWLLASSERKEILQIFEKELPSRLAAIREALARNDVALLALLAHQLHGVAGSYGFPEIGLRAAHLESEAEGARDPMRLERLVAHLLADCSRSFPPPAPPFVA
jgi:CheY-like chemotaxis protein